MKRLEPEDCGWDESLRSFRKIIINAPGLKWPPGSEEKKFYYNTVLISLAVLYISELLLASSAVTRKHFMSKWL